MEMMQQAGPSFAVIRDLRPATHLQHSSPKPEVQAQAQVPAARETPSKALALDETALKRCSVFAVGLGIGLCTKQRQRGGQRRRHAPWRNARGGESQDATVKLEPQDRWIAALDLESFGREAHELGIRLAQEQGEEDARHLKKMIFWSNLCGAIGLATAWLSPNPLTVLALSLWTHSRWTMIGHHCSHGGYDKTDKSGWFKGRRFALGSLWNRVRDWFDWLLPEAWGVEHNAQHHYKLGEDADPDLVERNVAHWDTPFKRWSLTFVSLLTWKWSYYASNTYKELLLERLRRSGESPPAGLDPLRPMTLAGMLRGEAKGLFTFWQFFRDVIGPYLLIHFVLLPAPFAFINPAFFWNAVRNLFLADVLTNIHSFIVIGTNHCGNDLYRFACVCKPKSPTFYLRAVTSSVNFRTGGDLNDFLHGWLNYQIEHHAWPNLSMLAYRRGQPRMKALCEKYGVPYVQENVGLRLKKTLDIMLGRSKMRRYPMELERGQDQLRLGQPA